jgi:hypothetical protein
MTYSICESVVAIVTHVRVLSEKGLFLGGGADTLSLCGKKVAWDTQIPVASSTVTCKICRALLESK